jgi:hypothetical protein
MMQTDTGRSTSVFPDYIDPISGERFVPDDSGGALISPGRTVPIVGGNRAS